MGGPRESYLTKYFYPLGFASFGFGSVGVANYYARRPFFAGIQRHIVFTIAGFIAGVYFDKYYEKRIMERDAMISHYIELHPEDFVEKKRKYKEVFDAWYPMR